MPAMADPRRFFDQRQQSMASAEVLYSAPRTSPANDSRRCMRPYTLRARVDAAQTLPKLPAALLVLSQEQAIAIAIALAGSGQRVIGDAGLRVDAA